MVDRHERLANGEEPASVGASGSRHGFPQRHDRYDADDADDVLLSVPTSRRLIEPPCSRSSSTVLAAGPLSLDPPIDLS
jgi:hypothetical protein